MPSVRTQGVCNMWYHETEDVSQIGLPVEDGLIDATVVGTLLIGVVFIAMGRFGKQRWLIHWGVITIVACGLYFFADFTSWFN